MTRMANSTLKTKIFMQTNGADNYAGDAHVAFPDADAGVAE